MPCEPRANSDTRHRRPRRSNHWANWRLIALCLGLVGLLVDVAETQTLRVVSYNIDADTGGADGQMGGVYAGPGLSTVLQAIGNVHLGSTNNAQPIDVLTLQELNLTRTTTTLGFIVDQL